MGGALATAETNNDTILAHPAGMELSTVVLSRVNPYIPISS